MDFDKALRKSKHRAGGHEWAFVLLVVAVLGWQLPAGHTQAHTSRTAPKDNSAEAAERNDTNAASLSKTLTQDGLRESVRLYRTSAEEFLKARMPQRAAAAEIDAGNTLNLMSSYGRAIDAYRRALKFGGDRVQILCTALTGLTWTESNMGQSADALRDGDAAVDACTPNRNADARAYERAVEAKGEAEFWSAQVEKATATLTQAEELATLAKDTDGEALSAMLLAENVHPTAPETAHQLIDNAMELWRRSGNVYGAARGNLALAYFAGREGNYSAAECRSKYALAVFERMGDHDNAGVAFNVLGMVARRSGDLASAAEAYRRARGLFLAAKDELGEGDAISGLMDVSVDLNDTSSPGLYFRGLELARTTHNQALLATALVGIGDIEFREHRATEARNRYRRGLDAAREANNPMEEALVMGRLARSAAADGDLDRALDWYAQAVALDGPAGAIEDVARARYLRAHIYLEQGKTQEALAEIEETVATVEHQRLRIARFESRAQYFAWVHEYYALYIRILMALDRANPNKNYAQRAFEVSERSKARAFLDELTTVSENVTCGDLATTATHPEAIFTSAESTDVIDEGPAKTDTHALNVEELQAEMAANSATLVEFALNEKHSFVWLLDGKDLSTFEIEATSDELRRRVAKFRLALEPLIQNDSERPEEFLQRRENQRRAVVTQSHELGHLLFGRIFLPACKRLIIVPDGALEYLPFASLEIPNGEPLVERYDLAVLPSATALEALRGNFDHRTPPRNEVWVFADPVYKQPMPRTYQPGGNGEYAQRSGPLVRSPELTRALRDFNQGETIPSLPGSRREALNIRSIMGASRTHLATGYEASRGAVMRGVLAQARIVHFATHGFLNAQRPEDSGLVLALFEPNGHAQDGYLRIHDVYGLKLSADLVVLSSCESALGKDMGSEGIIGLPRAFLHAGAQRVVASLWEVDDEATALLMTSFYRALQAGGSPAAALSEAQRKLRQHPRFHDPYFWAAFFLEGEYR